jgi:hypothetical protein
MALDPSAGWSMTPFGTPSQSTMQLSPQQAAQIQHITAAMQQQQPPASPQQQQMMSGLFGPQGSLGQNLGSMGGAFAGGPAYGGGSILTGDAYGGSAANPLPGLTAADYG